MRHLVLLALKLLPNCDALATLPELWRFQLDCEIPNLEFKFGRQISIRLQFVCRHWITLLCKVDCNNEVIAELSRCIPVLHYWVAVMGILGEIEQAVRGLRALYLWLVCFEIAMYTYL